MRLIDADEINLYKATHDELIMEIDDAPTIEPKKGKWIEQKGSDMIEDGMVCSSCGRYIHDFLPLTAELCTLEFEQELVKDFRFCPNCGAEMGGEENGKE